MNKSIPTPEEFNRKMHECVEYEKLNNLKQNLKWFNGKVGDMDITELINVINKRIEEIPEESINFDIEVHGQTTNNE